MIIMIIIAIIITNTLMQPHALFIFATKQLHVNGVLNSFMQLIRGHRSGTGDSNPNHHQQIKYCVLLL